jgi:hypothetical protein
MQIILSLLSAVCRKHKDSWNQPDELLTHRSYSFRAVFRLYVRVSVYVCVCGGVTDSESSRVLRHSWNPVFCKKHSNKYKVSPF